MADTENGYEPDPAIREILQYVTTVSDSIFHVPTLQTFVFTSRTHCNWSSDAYSRTISSVLRVLLFTVQTAMQEK